jgi:hypothetical protein
MQGDNMATFSPNVSLISEAVFEICSGYLITHNKYKDCFYSVSQVNKFL